LPILTIIAAPTRNNPANIGEQGLEVRGQGIAGLMQVPNHLVQIIPKPYKLSVDKPINIGCRGALRERAALVEKKSASEMNWPQAECGGALTKIVKFCGCEAQIELLISGLSCFLWSSHVRTSLAERMRPGD
jgi:hypothetical protein